MPPAEERPSLRARARAHRRRWIGRLVLAAVLALVGYLVLTFVQVLSASRDDDRVRSDAIVVLGAGEDVTVTGWSELPPRSSTAPVVHDPVSGVWELTVAVPARGWTTVEVLAG